MSLSLNITIHNKGYLIDTVLRHLRANTTGNYELVMVLDACTDNSLQRAEKFVKQNPQIETKIIVSSVELFECKGNNLAAKNSTGDYIAILQDDQVIIEKGWDERILKPFKAFEDVFAVGGRSAHNWGLNPYSMDLMRARPLKHRWCDILFVKDLADRYRINRDTFACRDYINRAPYVVNHKDFQALNYFDESFSPMIGEEIDLAYRVKKLLNKRFGVYWIDWFARSEWGSTRDIQTGETKEWVYEASHKNLQEIYRRHKDIIDSHIIENRELK